VHLGDTIDFVGGDDVWSYIKREKVSIFEIVNNLKLHMMITDKDSIFCIGCCRCFRPATY
jgi:3'-phosphoadenosine 5'-phosphosulfate sulfotransferase (PAPS reductase)/FAD synthetase